jgi:hypothetical protein
VPVPCFLLFLCFRKATQEIFSELDKTKASRPKIYQASREPKRSWSGAMRGPHTRAVWPGPWPRPLCVRPPRSTSDDAPSPIKTHRWEKPKDPINFPEHIAIRRCHWPEDREGPEALPGTLPERGIATGGLLHRHACLWSDKWVVYLGLWVHSSS